LSDDSVAKLGVCLVPGVALNVTSFDVPLDGFHGLDAAGL